MSFPPAHAALQALLFLERVSPAHQSALEAGGGGSAATGTEVPVLLATGKQEKILSASFWILLAYVSPSALRARG